MISKQVRILNPIEGKIKVEDFEIVDVEIPKLQSGEILIENIYCSTDPYVRSTMGTMIAEPFNTIPNQPIQGDAVGTVIESNNPKFSVGTNIIHRHGWRTHTVLSELDDNEYTRIIPGNHKILDYLSIYGLVGITAYYSLKKVLNPNPGDIVVIDGATGGVGQLFVQMAVADGLTVYGITSTQEKVDYIDNIGCLLYTSPSPRDS